MGIFKTEEAVRCCKCGQLHPVKSSKYIAFKGNISIGEDVDIIGTNLDESNTVTGVSIFCRHTTCLRDIVSQMYGTPERIER